MVEFIKKEHNITYGTFDVEATTPSDYPEALKEHVGNSYGGELTYFFKLIIMTSKSKILCASDEWFIKILN